MSSPIDSSGKPTGRDEVVAALKEATSTLVREKGSRFSVREVASAAGVNQGLIYRHFGSKEQLISATVAEMTLDLSDQLRSGGSAVDIMVTKSPDAAMMLARLVLDDAASLITEHPAIEAMIASARESRVDGGPAPQARVAIASATILGWALFGDYLTNATRADPDDDILATLRDLIAQLLTGRWPDSTDIAPEGRE